MTQTEQLIDTLVAGATPVRRLRPPLLRALSWLALAGAILALLAIGHGVRSGLVAHLRQPIFVSASPPHSQPVCSPPSPPSW